MIWKWKVCKFVLLNFIVNWLFNLHKVIVFEFLCLLYFLLPSCLSNIEVKIYQRNRNILILCQTKKECCLKKMKLELEWDMSEGEAAVAAFKRLFSSFNFPWWHIKNLSFLLHHEQFNKFSRPIRKHHQQQHHILLIISFLHKYIHTCAPSVYIHTYISALSINPSYVSSSTCSFLLTCYYCSFWWNGWKYSNEWAFFACLEGTKCKWNGRKEATSHLFQKSRKWEFLSLGKRPINILIVQHLTVWW